MTPMRFLFVLAVLMVAVPIAANAHVPYLVDELSRFEAYNIDGDPEVSRAFYGELRGAPDTFEIVAEEPFELFVQVSAPALDTVEPIYNGIIVEVLPRGGVTEVARLPAASVPWTERYEWFDGDTYLEGPTFTGELAAGTYRIEVSTPDNIGKYVLVTGFLEDQSEIGFFETMRRIAAVKEFFEKPRVAVLQSPFYYVPLLIVIGLCGGLWYWRRRLAHHEG